MDTTTLSAFWEGIASTSGTFITGNQTFWILLGQVILVVGALSFLFIAIRKAAKRVLGGDKGRFRRKY